jgi:hypothetical protein
MKTADGDYHPTALLRRTAWGCDTPTTQAVFTISCPKCHRSGSECSVCGGTGQAPVFDCPFKDKGAVQEVGGLISFLRDAEDAGVLPAAGGMLDQTAFFVKAFRIFVHARGKAQEHAMEKQKKESESASKQHSTSMPGIKKPQMPRMPRR